jgi:signal transduction histidine kinase
MSIISLLRRGINRGQEGHDFAKELEDLGSLMAYIEHEVKGPLQIIATEVNVLERETQPDSKVLRRTTVINREVQRIFAVMRMIQVLRARPEDYDELMTKVSVRDLITRSITTTKRKLRSAPIYFHVTSDAALFTSAYQPVMELAIVSLLDRAVDDIRKAERLTGLVDIKWGIKPNEHGQFVNITISDNGPGIPDPKSDAFKDVANVESPNRRNMEWVVFGRVLELHKAAVQVQRRRDEGTTVTITLPKWKDRR